MVVYQRQGHVCVRFILWFQWKELDWSARLGRQQQRALRASDRLLLNTNERNEYSATLLEIFHLLQVCLYCEMFQKLTFRWRRSRIYRGISDLSAYRAGANARVWFISDLFLHMNEAWNRSENIGVHVTFSCLRGRGPYPICATWEEKIGIGSLELCSVNAAIESNVSGI